MTSWFDVLLNDFRDIPETTVSALSTMRVDDRVSAE